MNTILFFPYDWKKEGLKPFVIDLDDDDIIEPIPGLLIAEHNGEIEVDAGSVLVSTDEGLLSAHGCRFTFAIPTQISDGKEVFGAGAKGSLYALKGDRARAILEGLLEQYPDRHSFSGYIEGW